MVYAEKDNVFAELGCEYHIGHKIWYWREVLFDNSTRLLAGSPKSKNWQDLIDWANAEGFLVTEE